MNPKNIQPNINNYISNTADTIKPSKNAHKGLSVPAIVFEYGSLVGKLKILPHIMPNLIKSIRQVAKAYRQINTQPKVDKRIISKKEMDDLKAYLSPLGISVGFARVSPDIVFDDKQIMYDQAIVLLMPMKKVSIKTAPSSATAKEIFRTYYALNVAANKATRFLKQRGFKAHAGPALGGEVNYPMLAQKAGMGYIGKHGMLITKQFGPCLRLAAVYTKINNLPIEDINQHSWIAGFCQTCNTCVKACPANAIRENAIVFKDGSLQNIDFKKCAIPFSNNKGCTVCIKSCTFFGNNYSAIKKAHFSKNRS